MGNASEKKRHTGVIASAALNGDHELETRNLGRRQFISAKFKAPDMLPASLFSAICGTSTLRSALAVCFAVAMLSPAHASDTDSSPGAVMAFRIPPQPLGKALARFGEISGNTLLADGLIIDGRRSAPLDGTFTPQDALIALLNGTGLEAKRLGETAFTLNRTEGISANRLALSQSGEANPAVLAAIQTAVIEALCRSAQTRPGDYNAVLHLWIDGKGRIDWLEEARSSGNDDRDKALESMLLGLKIEGLPPETTQTVTVAIQPQRSQAAPCRP